VRIAVISDVHANWQALEAVLADFGSIDDVICLGDIVGYGGDPVRCLDHVRAQGWLTLTGNHDRACADEEVLAWFNHDAAVAIRWTVGQLGDERIEWLRALPERGEREGAQLVHASPRSPVFEYVLDLHSADENLSVLPPSTICFHGHTHLPGVFSRIDGEVTHRYEPGETRIAGPALVNPGSVGQPRDRNPDASYGIWDTEAGTFEFRRVPYDRSAAQRAIRIAGLPQRFASRLDGGY
jgi:diadenosine tetraphosphatase ApaH/serine/threonine PP2A family protein phosphatase